MKSRWLSTSGNAKCRVPAPRTNDVLNRLDGLSPWAFTGSLYLIRWAVIIPIVYAIRRVNSPAGSEMGFADPVIGLVIVVLDPLLETLLECSFLYWLMRKIGRIPVGERPWGFVAVSAIMMALLHVGAWPSAILPSLVTGVFLAYVYSHFATARTGLAILHTWAFHAAINIVGWILAVFSQ